MCMARAVVVGKCHADKVESETWKKTWNLMRHSNRPLQTREAKLLLDQANIPHDTVCGIEEYKKTQAVLAPDYLIKVHSQHPKQGLVFTPQFKKQRNTKVDHLYWNGDNHYDCVTSVKALLGVLTTASIVTKNTIIKKITHVQMDVLHVTVTFHV